MDFGHGSSGLCETSEQGQHSFGRQIDALKELNMQHQVRKTSRAATDEGRAAKLKGKVWSFEMGFSLWLFVFQLVS